MKRAVMTMALLAFSPPAAAQGSGIWTAARVKATPPSEITRQLFGEMAQSLFPDTRWKVFEPSGQLWWLHFFSTPRAGINSGFCETDWVRIHFTPIDPSHKTNGVTDVPVRPGRIEASPRYFVWDMARALRGGIRAEGEQARFEQICAARDPGKERPISAFDPDDIVIALRLVRDLTDAARAGRALVPLDCSPLARRGNPVPNEVECLAEVAAIRPDQVDHASQPKVTATGVTRRIFAEKRWLHFSFAPGQTLTSHDLKWRPSVAIPLRVTIDAPPDPPPLI